LTRIDTCVEALEKLAAQTAASDTPEFASKALEDFSSAVNDDLNVPKAFAALFELVRHANAWMQGETQPEQASAILDVFRRMDSVLGVIFFGKAEKADVPAEIQVLLDQRAEARKSRNWAESDRLRDEIAAAGWIVKDSKDGQSVTKK
jgi:cysteinyl-tRNA synthetase